MGAPAGAQDAYLYSPFAAAVFEAPSGLSFATWQLALVLADMILLPLTLLASPRVRGRDDGRAGTRAVALALSLAAISLWLEPVFGTLAFGQINLVLLGLIMGDLALPGSSRWKGTGIGVAAGVKLTPLIFIPYLLATRRLRAGGVAALSFAATIGIGFPLNESLDAVVNHVVTGHEAQHLVWLALAAVTGVCGMVIAIVAARRGQDLLGIVMCGVTGLLVSPISWTRHWVWAVPALALAVTATDRIRRAAGPRPSSACS